MANCYTAVEQGVTVVPVLNKIDLPSADPERVIDEIADIIGIDATDAVRASAKNGVGIDDILEAVIAKIPPPKGDRAAPLQALIIDSWFDNYVGVVMLVRVMQGVLRPRDKLLLMAGGSIHNCEQVGVFTPEIGRARRAFGGRRRFHHRGHQGAQGRARSATRSRSQTGAPTRRCRDSRK